MTKTAKMTVVMVIVAAAVVGTATIGPQITRTTTTATQSVPGRIVTAASPGTPALSPTATLQQQVVAASTYASRHGSHAGWHPSAPGVLSATGDGVVLLSLRQGGVCYAAAATPGQPVQIQTDPTGAACTPQEMAQAALTLSSSKQQAASAAQTQVVGNVVAAAADVQFYATSNFVNGQPSFTGLSTTAVQGVSIAGFGQGGQTVTLRAQQAPGGCALAVVPIQGPVTPTHC